MRNVKWLALPLALAGLMALDETVSFEDTVDVTLQASVAVGGGGFTFAQDQSGFMLGGGSGSIHTPEGHIVTNCHVMGWGDQRQAFIRLNDGEIVPARLSFSNCKIDVAIVQMIPEDPDRVFPHVRFGDSNDTLRGETVYAVGNPGDSSNFSLFNLYKDFLLKNTVTSGVIRDRVLSPQIVARMNGGVAIGGTQGVVDYGTELSETFDTDATINGGNSGGPLFNANGEQIGVNFAGSSFIEGQNMAIAGNDAKKTLDDVIEHGRVVYAWLGLYVFIDRAEAEYSDEISIQGNSPIQGSDGFRGRNFYDRTDLYIKEARESVATPFVVRDTFPDGPSELAGIKKGDKIHEVGFDENGDGAVTDDEMRVPEDAFVARFWVRALEKGDLVALRVSRGGSTYVVEFEMGEQPPEGMFAGGTL